MIVGVDVSSRRVDLAWLEDGNPCRWHQELGKGHLIDRLREIRIQWPARYDVQAIHGSGHEQMIEEHRFGAFDVTDIAIEYPMGRGGQTIHALGAVTGIVTRQAPPWARVAWPSSGELRAAIGARNTKEAAHAVLQANLYLDHEIELWGWDEHELDALTACIGWTRILEQQEGAA